MNSSNDEHDMLLLGEGEGPLSAKESVTASSYESSEVAASSVTSPPKVERWGELNLSVSEWAYICVGVVCLWILISVVLACFCGPDFVTCHLCQQQIPRRFWESGEHRTDCMKSNEQFLEELPTNKNRCPICYKHLKSWPARLGAEFVCMSPHRCTGPNADGSGKRATRNLTGDDRLTCYKCDFDMCRNCANGVGSASRSRASGTTPTTVNNNGWLAAAAAEEGLSTTVVSSGMILQNNSGLVRLPPQSNGDVARLHHPRGGGGDGGRARDRDSGSRGQQRF